MKLLILGGSIFLGRHVVEIALARGHQVTVFNRGNHPIDAHPALEQVRGDRDSDLARLQGREYDSVIDCCAYTPAQAALAGEALRRQVAHCVFISTISVYQRFAPGVCYDETAPVTDATNGYGGGKARAEEVIEQAFPGRVARIRPGLIVGPHDPTGRFTYWPLRLARGGTVLAPGRPQRPVQWIDVRDLAGWCVDLAERRTAGIFNAVGPQASMADLLEICRAACNPQAGFSWVSDAQLLQLKAEPWTGLPLWIPEADPDFGGMLLADAQRARAAGLVTRPWADTVRDTFEWARHCGATAPGTAGISPALESELLASLQA